MALVAGAAQVDITPDPAGGGIELMGYGARIGSATGTHDRLSARALWLGVAGSAPESAGVLIVSADLCLMAPVQADDVRARISAKTGVSPERMLVACTHTHSGPDTGLGALTAGISPPDHCAALFQGLADAGVTAITGARPARLAWSRADVAIGRNRRLADGPVDTRLLVLRVDGQDGSPLAVLFHHACHGTVLGHDNLEISADWPGVASARIAAETGAIALFLLGAHADIDPRTRGLMDLAIPGQSVGLGFEAVRVLGLEVADAVLAALDDGPAAEGGPPAAGGAVAAARTHVRLPLHPGDLPEAETRRTLEARKRELAELLDVPLAEFPRLSQLQSLAERSTRELPLAEARRRLSLARLYLRDKAGPFFVGGRREVDVEVQVLRIGDTALLALPLEPTTHVGLDWSRRATRHVARGSVCGIGNGWLRYLPHADDFAHPQAGEHYEVLMSTFAPEACERLLRAGEELLRTLS